MRDHDTYMTLRVSRDGGKTFGPQVVYSAANNPLLPLMSDRWPMCRCPRCQVSADVAEQQLQVVLARISARRTLGGPA
ncbi:hypothetical protein CGL27_20885 [Streptomyces sp. 11-1-2]|nr:hypothetical protein CGL27_20885 [Streptomyces sp. 11-1-2]